MMSEFNAIYKEFSEETHCYHYIIRKVSFLYVEYKALVAHRIYNSKCQLDSFLNVVAHCWRSYF